MIWCNNDIRPKEWQVLLSTVLSVGFNHLILQKYRFLHSDQFICQGIFYLYEKFYIYYTRSTLAKTECLTLVQDITDLQYWYWLKAKIECLYFQTLLQSLLGLVKDEHRPNYSLLLLWASLANAVPVRFLYFANCGSRL